MREAIVERGEAPTVVEIGEAVGMSNRSSVHYQLRELQEKGAIVREPCRPAGSGSHDGRPQGYHLTLSTGDRPVMHGWWGDRGTAERKFLPWVGEHSTVDGAQIVLVGRADDTVLTRWLDEP
ncbi:hypothetical protein OG324_51130 [Streptomyces sp. NBC_01236]|nr:hypothetical protein OG324_51130 [Streptomyces sp. NBC_01236]